MFNRFNNLGKKIRTEEDLNDTKKVSATPTSDKEKARKKLLKIVGIISIVLIAIFLIILVGTMLVGTTYTFDQMELELKNAAIKYYQVQDALLPANEGEKSEVEATNLASDDYKLMKPLSKL